MTDSHVLFFCGLVTQMVEQWTNNLKVVGSNAIQATNFHYHIFDTPGDGSNPKIKIPSISQCLRLFYTVQQR